jgi:hypothetical protein
MPPAAGQQSQPLDFRVGRTNPRQHPDIPAENLHAFQIAISPGNQLKMIGSGFQEPDGNAA